MVYSQTLLSVSMGISIKYRRTLGISHRAALQLSRKEVVNFIHSTSLKFVGLKPEQIFIQEHQRKKTRQSHSAQVPSIDSIWQSMRATVGCVKIYRHGQRRVASSMPFQMGAGTNVLLGQSVDDQPLQTLLSVFSNIQRHVSKGFTPHIML